MYIMLSILTLEMHMVVKKVQLFKLNAFTFSQLLLPPS